MIRERNFGVRPEWHFRFWRKELRWLAGLENLERLGLGNTQVSDLAPLAELENLKRLTFEDTQVTDIAPLAGLENLEWLSLYDTQVSPEQVQALRQALPNCRIGHD